MVRFGILGCRAHRQGACGDHRQVRSGERRLRRRRDSRRPHHRSPRAWGHKWPRSRRSSRSDVEAVLIATPTDTHAELIEQAARAGKAILCEKPVSLSVERIEACLPVVERGRRAADDRLQPPLRPEFRRAASSGCAPATSARWRSSPSSRATRRRRRSSYIERSGGLYRDMMIHDFDMARFLVGEEFVTVHALGSALVDKAIGAAGDVDTAAVQMQTASGKIAVITNSRRATYGYDQRIEVHGSKGMLRAGNVHMTTLERADAAGFTAGRDPELLHRPLCRGLCGGGECVHRRGREGHGADAFGRGRAEGAEAGGSGDEELADGGSGAGGVGRPPASLRRPPPCLPHEGGGEVEAGLEPVTNGPPPSGGDGGAVWQAGMRALSFRSPPWRALRQPLVSGHHPTSEFSSK